LRCIEVRVYAPKSGMCVSPSIRDIGWRVMPHSDYIDLNNTHSPRSQFANVSTFDKMFSSEYVSSSGNPCRDIVNHDSSLVLISSRILASNCSWSIIASIIRNIGPFIAMPRTLD
jgi:hypothetical protein